MSKILTYLSKIAKILTRLQYKCSKHVQKRSKAFKKLFNKGKIEGPNSN